MNAAIQTSLANYEKHLDTLIDSISSYNPSPSAATSLVEADDDLSESLSLLARHQRNHAELVSLRATSAALDERIRGVMRTLAESRKMLMDAAPPPPPRRPADEEDRKLDARTLLMYAQHIARFTVPPTHRANLPPPSSGAAATGASPDADGQQGHEPLTYLEGQRRGAEGNEDAKPEEKRNRALAALTPEQRVWLSPHSEGWAMPFIPWPDEDTIRRGALGSIQAALDEGKDPDAPGVVEGAMEVDRKNGSAEGEQEQDRPEVDRRFSTSAPGMTAAALTKEEARKKKEEQEKMFEGFELYNPDED